MLVEDKRAVGAELTDGRTIRARREVVLSAGTVQTPQILMLSGIGPAAHLKEMGIEVALDAPGVGANYHDHPASPMHMETSNWTSYGWSLKATPRNLWCALQYALTRKGPLAGNVFESVAFLRTDPSFDRPDVQFVFQPAKRLTNPRIPFPIGHGYAISPVALYPKSRGTVRLASPDPLAAPLIDPHLLEHPDDIKPLIRALRIARAAFASEPFAEYEGVEVAPGPECQTDEQFDAYIRETGYTVHHPVGTCPIGPADARAGDARGLIHGLANAFVADCSIMPVIPRANTNIPAVVIGERDQLIQVILNLVEKETMTAPHFEKSLHEKAPFLKWVPVLFVSALSGQRVQRVLPLLLEVQAARTKRIPTHEVNEVIRELVGHARPPHAQGRAVKLLYATQVSIAPPTFVIWSNLPDAIPESYVRYLHNGFRDRWGFRGAPIRIQLRRRREEGAE